MTIEDEYRARTPAREALRRGPPRAPSGITHDARYLDPYSIHVARAKGPRKWDVDGNEYVDYFGGHGALLFGHGHRPVIEAVQRQAELGTHWGASHELEVRWAELVQRLIPSAERVRFTASGTEASHLALRLARAYTGKSKIVASSATSRLARRGRGRRNVAPTARRRPAFLKRGRRVGVAIG
jgi:glutamate-1-semialdehyde 2,1-aminomutase